MDLNTLYILQLFFLLIISKYSIISCNRISNSNKISQPNILLIFTDDQRADALGIAPNPHIKTPNIDNLADNGLVFKNTYLTTSSCSPSRNSIITGRYPHNTGGAELHTEPPLEMISVGEILKNNEDA